MKKSIKKFIVALSLVILSATYCFAAIPMVVAGLVGAGSLLATVGAISWYQSTSASKTIFVGPDGSLRRGIVAAWTIYDQYARGSTQSQRASLHASYQSVKNKIVEMRTVLPDLYNLYFKPFETTKAEKPRVKNPSELINTWFQYGGVWHRIATVQDSQIGISYMPNSEVGLGPNPWKRTYTDGYSYHYEYVYKYKNAQNQDICDSFHYTSAANSANPADHSVTDPEHNPSAPPVGDRGMDFTTTAINSFPDSYSGDIDALISAAPNIFESAATDDVEGTMSPPWAIPTQASPLIPTVTDLGVANNSAQQSRLQQAQTAADQAAADLAADPTNETLIEQNDVAQQELENAQTAANDAVNQQAEVYPGASMDTLKSLNFVKLKDLINVMGNVFPFNLLSSVSGYFSPFVSSPVAPSFDLPIYQDNSLHIDLAFFDPVATLCRWVISILLTVGSIMGIVRFYRGVS